MGTVYEYHTLGGDDIRLLHLFSGEDDDDLAATLNTYTLDSTPDGSLGPATPRPVLYDAPPPYSALSYCWGQHDPTSKLWLTHSKNATTKPFLSIKPNLESALKKLRRGIKPGESTILWIDAVCINQADVPERNAQIQKMADIYAEAISVHIWLGDQDKNSDLAVKFAKEIKNPKYFEQALEGDRTIDRSGEWLAFSKLIHRDWFSRRWIVQEISLAKSAIVHCGGESIAWDDLEEAVSIFSTMHGRIRRKVRSSVLHGNPVDFLGEVNGMGALHLVEIASNITRRTPESDRAVMEHRMSLEGLMSSLTMFETSDPYDVVYALLWLAHDVRPDAALSDINLTKSPINSNSPGLRFDTGSQASNGHVRNDRLAAANLGRTYQRRPSASDVLQEVNRQQGGVMKKLIVDYNMSLFQCYKTFLEHVFQQSKSLDIICRAWALEPSQRQPPGAAENWKPERPLPSWIMTLTDNKVFDINPSERVYERTGADPLVGKPGTGPRPYNACGKRKHEGDYAIIKDQDRSLVVRGFSLGDICERHDPASVGNIPEDWLKALGWTSKPHAQEQARSIPLGSKDRPDWLWRFLVAERGHDGYQPPPLRFRSACTWLLDHRTRNKGLKTDVVLDAGHFVLASEYIDRVRAVVFDRRLVMISYGPGKKVLKGLAPKDARVGDCVCILFGCSVPVVLRRIKDDNQPGSSNTTGGLSAPTIAIDMYPQGPAMTLRLPREPDPKRPRLDTSVVGTGSETLDPAETGVRGSEENNQRATMPDLDQHDERFEFIGECYVYGMMAGEGFKHGGDNRSPHRYWNLV